MTVTTIINAARVLRPRKNNIPTDNVKHTKGDRLPKEKIISLEPPTTPKKQQIGDIKYEKVGLSTPPNSISKKRKRLQFPIDDDLNSEMDHIPQLKKGKHDYANEQQNLHSSLPLSPCKTPSPSKLSTSPSPQKLVFGRDSIYSRTKALLQRSAGLFAIDDSGCLPTRETQYNEILNFLNDNIENGTSNSLYITGPPGTGKTAQINSIFKNHFLPIILPSEQNNKNGINNACITLPKLNANLNNQSYFKLQNNGEVKTVTVTSLNCIAFTDPSSVFNKIYESFHNNNNSTANTTANKIVRNMKDLQNFMELYSKETTFIVVLDEIDKLLHSSLNDTQATKTLFELFLLARLPNINFLLIGIANSLDLKDRFLSRLNLRQDLLPRTIIFHPYSADDMFNIIMQRINTIQTAGDDQCIFKPMAIKFASKKCSGSTGDLRRLFDVLRNSIELVELELVTHLRRDPSNEFKIIQVGIPHIAKVFGQIVNSTSTKSSISRLNLQQKIILCSLVHREKTDIFQTYCSMDDAYDYYTKFLKNRDSLKPLKRNEYLEISNTLETCGVVSITRGKAPGKTRQAVKLIKTIIDEKEFEEEMNKIEILKRFI